MAPPQYQGDTKPLTPFYQGVTRTVARRTPGLIHVCICTLLSIGYRIRPSNGRYGFPTPAKEWLDIIDK